jgi:hypothetical protein
MNLGSVAEFTLSKSSRQKPISLATVTYCNITSVANNTRPCKHAKFSLVLRSGICKEKKKHSLIA